MAKLSLPVPPAFVITTETCLEYFKEGTGNLPAALDYESQLKALEDDTGKKFGDPSTPLLVSVRSGAPASMPGEGARSCDSCSAGSLGEIVSCRRRQVWDGSPAAGRFLRSSLGCRGKTHRGGCVALPLSGVM